MIQIQKAILHVFDYTHATLTLSESTMSEEDMPQLVFARKQIEKLIESPVLKKGEFKEESKVKDLFTKYVDEENLVEISSQIANSWYSYIKMSDKIDSATLLVADVFDNAKHLLVFLKYKNKNAYTYEGKLYNGLFVNHVVESFSVLPNASQSVDECFIVDLDSLNIYYKDNKRVIDGEQCSVIADRLLFCTSELSQKEIITTIKEATEDFCDHYDMDAMAHLAKTKSYIQEKLADDGYLRVEELSQEVFPQEAMQEEFKQNLADLNVPEDVYMHAKYASSATKMTRMKTDTGIQIAIPSIYFEDKEHFEVIQNEDQTLTIQIKNVLYIK